MDQPCLLVDRAGTIKQSEEFGSPDHGTCILKLISGFPLRTPYLLNSYRPLDTAAPHSPEFPLAGNPPTSPKSSPISFPATTSFLQSCSTNIILAHSVLLRFTH